MLLLPDKEMCKVHTKYPRYVRVMCVSGIDVVLLCLWSKKSKERLRCCYLTVTPCGAISKVTVDGANGMHMICTYCVSTDVQSGMYPIDLLA